MAGVGGRGCGGLRGKVWGEGYNPAFRNLSGWDLFLFCEGV